MRLCWNKQLRTDLVEQAVWEEVCRLLEHPERLEQEYRRRLLQEEQPSDELGSLKQIETHAQQITDEAGLERELKLTLWEA